MPDYSNYEYKSPYSPIGWRKAINNIANTLNTAEDVTSYLTNPVKGLVHNIGENAAYDTISKLAELTGTTDEVGLASDLGRIGYNSAILHKLYKLHPAITGVVLGTTAYGNAMNGLANTMLGDGAAEKLQELYPEGTVPLDIRN